MGGFVFFSCGNAQRLFSSSIIRLLKKPYNSHCIDICQMEIRKAPAAAFNECELETFILKKGEKKI